MEKLSYDDKMSSLVFKFEDNENGLENYQINKEIGKGSFGKVYSAIHLKTGEKVAIKKIVSKYY